MERSFNTTTTARVRPSHRAARRPALADIARAATQHAASFADRTAMAAAAGSGVLLSLIAAPAHAAPNAGSVDTSVSGASANVAFGTLDLQALNSQARQVVAAASVVTVAPDTKVQVENAVVSVVPAIETDAY